jgi:DNA-binding transcriptional LysR family regulator
MRRILACWFRAESRNTALTFDWLIPTMATGATLLLTRLLARARLRHLALFVKVAELGSLKRAAEAMHLSQPAATQLLADLERLVEVPLFERHSRGVRITAAGRALLPVTRRSLDALADGTEALATVRREGEGRVRLAAITAGISGLLVRALPVFAREAPALRIHVEESDADRCAEQLVRHDVDLALCREPPVLPAGCRFSPLLADDFVVACGPAHPLARRRRVAWSTLARERWLLPPVQSAARRAFDERMATLGTVPPSSPVVTRVSSLTWALLQGDRLLTLVPYGVVRQLVEAGQLNLVDATPPLPFAPLGLLIPQTGVTMATETFVAFLGRFVRPPA